MSLDETVAQISESRAFLLDLLEEMDANPPATPRERAHAARALAQACEAARGWLRALGRHDPAGMASAERAVLAHAAARETPEDLADEFRRLLGCLDRMVGGLRPGSTGGRPH